MAELAAALAALSGGKAGGSSASPAPTPTPISPTTLAQPGWFIPPHLLRLPHCRASAFTAHECSREAASHPTDFERVYRYGLSLQELASKLAQQPADQLSLLHQAAEVYMEASQLQGGRHAAALYNWAVALTDIARLVRAQQPEEAYECLAAAASKYAQSLAVHSDNPQANNNLGLVLQDLSSLRPAAERAAYLRHSLHKFRRAIRLRPDFDRACYNLGTVLYSHACSLQEELLASQEAAVAFQLADVADARLAADPSLPVGAAIWLGLGSQPRGVYLVAADQDDAEGWVDALLLLSHLVRAGRTAGVEAALSVRR